jgi:hypothetical protein
MIRKVMLALTMLAVAAAPVQAAMPTVSAQPRGHDVRDDHERFERFGQFRRFEEPHRFGYAYEPRCDWENAHWVKQVYPNGYGGFAYVPQYIPGQWICS